MVVFYLRNSRSPSGKIVPITVSLTLEDLVPQEAATRPDQDPAASGIAFPNLLDSEGNRRWLLTVSTTERDSSGNPIPPEFVNIVSKDTVHQEIEAAIGRIGKKIDWGTLDPDTQPPRLVSLTPGIDQVANVPIGSNIIIRLQDPLPAAGMDLSTLNVRLNGFPIVTSGIAEAGKDVTFQGNVFDLTITHRPVRIT